MKHLRFTTQPLLIIASIFWISCSNKSDHVNETNQHATDSTVKHEHEQTSHHETNVTLNNGQKWTANQETIIGIETMKNLVSLQSTEMSADDCIQLKSNLEAEFTNILNKCTMKGEAHEQLHLFLMPLKELIHGLGSNSTDSCNEKVNQVASYLDEFENYFQ